MDCIFCKIINKEIPSTIVYEDESVIAFKDLNPVAPVHILVVPNENLSSYAYNPERAQDILTNMGYKLANGIRKKEDIELMGKVLYTCKEIAASLPECDGGYRIINNCGDNAGQTVKHIHFHIIGGKEMLNLI